MTALTHDKQYSRRTLDYFVLTLASGTKSFVHGAAGIELGTGKVKPMAAGSSLLYVGTFDEQVDATAGDKPVNVRLPVEIPVELMANAAGGDAVPATDLGLLCYFYDDTTVGNDPTGRSPAGRVWEVTAEGVWIEKLSGERPLLLQPATWVYTSNDFAPTTVVHRAVYDVATTGAASTITLPAAAPSGTELYFQADGVKNGHTVQYRDATGPLNLTAALTASKRHLAICVKRGAVWAVTASVAP